MSNALGLKQVGTGNVVAQQIDGATVSQFGGEFYRETIGTLDNSGGNKNHRIVQMEDNTVCAIVWNGSTFASYYFEGTAVKIELSADPAGGSPTAGDTISVGANTATLLEDYEAGDNYVIVYQETPAALGTGAATFSPGGETATVTARVDNSGEWYKVYEATSAGKGVDFVTGIHPYRTADDDLAYAYVYQTSADEWRIVRRVGGTWSTSADIGTIATPGSITYFGPSTTNGNILYWLAGKGVSTSGVQTVNLLDESLTTHEANYGNPTNSYATANPLINWNNRVLRIRGHSSPDILDVTSGTPVTIASIPSPAGNAGLVAWVNPNDEALYAMQIGSFSGRCCRVVVDPTDNQVKVCNDMNDFSLRAALFPGGISTDVIGNSLIDYDTTPGSRICRIYIKTALANTPEVYVANGWTNLVSGSSVTWNGTQGNVDDVVFPSDPGLSVGDIIRHNTTNLSYEVAGITGGSNQNIQLVSGVTYPTTPPSTASVTSIAQAYTSSGTATGMVDSCLPFGTISAGDYVYTDGELHISVVGRTRGIGAETWTFEAYSPSGTETVNAIGYYLIKSDGTYGVATLQSVTGGSASMSGTTIQNITADNGSTQYTVQWNVTADGVPTGTAVARYLDVVI